MNNIRPTEQQIRSAFGEYTTECFAGYEQTAWDLLQIGGIELVFDILESVFPHAGIYEPFENYSDSAVTELITDYARRAQ